MVFLLLLLVVPTLFTLAQGTSNSFKYSSDSMRIAGFSRICWNRASTSCLGPEVFSYIHWVDPNWSTPHWKWLVDKLKTEVGFWTAQIDQCDVTPSGSKDSFAQVFLWQWLSKSCYTQAYTHQNYLIGHRRLWHCHWPVHISFRRCITSHYFIQYCKSKIHCHLCRLIACGNPKPIGLPVGCPMTFWINIFWENAYHYY